MSVLENLVEEVTAKLGKEASRELSLEGMEAVAPGQGSGLILESEAALTLGGPQVPSARLLLYSNADHAPGDTVRLVGELPPAGGPVSFAEVVVLYGAELDAEKFYQFTLRHKRMLDQPGVMVQNEREHIWLRMTPEAVRGGLEPVSATLISRIRKSFPQVQAVELWWIADRPDLVGGLGPQMLDASATLKGIVEGIWKDRGFDFKTCRVSSHCGNCADKKTCSSVRQIEAKVKMKRRREERERQAQQQASA